MKGPKKIKVVPYNPAWPGQFAVQAELIRKALRDLCIAVHHVGSTAVEGLAAKPRIDIIAVIKASPEDAIQKLEAAGFLYKGEYNIPFHYGFTKRDGVEVNLHVYKEGHPEIELNLTFRDYLRSHPEVRDEYAALKKKLLQDKASFVKQDAMFTGYNLGKDELIRRVLKETKFDRLRFLRCVHREEWKVAKELRQRYFFDKVPIQDPYEWTFNHLDHVHFVLCKGVKVIGYAHIQLWPSSRAAIRILVVEENQRSQGLGKQFLHWIEAWLKQKGYQSLHTESSPEVVPFYKRLGYIPMPFDDPDGYSTDARDTPLGKIL